MIQKSARLIGWAMLCVLAALPTSRAQAQARANAVITGNAGYQLSVRVKAIMISRWNRYKTRYNPPEIKPETINPRYGFRPAKKLSSRPPYLYTLD